MTITKEERKCLGGVLAAGSAWVAVSIQEPAPPFDGRDLLARLVAAVDRCEILQAAVDAAEKYRNTTCRWHGPEIGGQFGQMCKALDACKRDTP